MKKFLAGILCICLLVTMLPLSASASVGVERDGHSRLMAVDFSGKVGGGTGMTETMSAPSYMGWLGAGHSITYDLVNLNNAEYLSMCFLNSSQTNAQLEVYLDSETEPVAVFEAPLCADYIVETVPLTRAVTGQHTVTVKIIDGSPSVSWIRFLTEEENIPRKEIALVGDSNVQYGPYFTGFNNILDLEKYELKNYGHAGASIASYQNTEKCRNALADASDYYIITLGTNDLTALPEQISANFANSYKAFIESIYAANPNAMIYAQTPLPLQEETGDFQGRTEEELKEIVIPAIASVCAEFDIPVIDIYNGMLGSGLPRIAFMSDHVHVNGAGGEMMAKLTYEGIFGTPALGEGTAPGTVDSVTITVPKTELTRAGETVALTADKDVYWQVRTLEDNFFSNCATIDENGVLTAKSAGAYLVRAISKADTSVMDSVLFYNRFPFVAADLDYIIGNHFKMAQSGDIRDGGVRVNTLSNGVTFVVKDVDLTDITSVTARATSANANIPEESALEFYLDSPAGPMIAKSVITSTKLATTDYQTRYGDFKSAMVPVTDGALHDVYAVVKLPDTSFRYDLLSIDFGTGEENPVIVKDGKVQNPYSSNFTWTQGTYTLKSCSENTPVAALYDADGRVVSSVILTENEGVKEASITLSEDMPDATLRTYHWKDLSAMEPVTPAHMTYQKPITIGCIGDSLTRNLNSDTEDDNILSYPKFLGLALGDRFVVKNFGRGGATIGSYDETPFYASAKDAACDIYVIQLGTNDAKSGHSQNLEAEYQEIIDGLNEANPDAVIYLCAPFPVFGNGSGGIQESILTADVIPAIEAVAEANNLSVINVHDEILANPRVGEFNSGDNIHPKDVGMLYLAEIVKEGIFGK